MGSWVMLLLSILVVVPRCTNRTTYITTFKNPVRRMFTYVSCVEGYIQYYVMYSKGREGGSLRPAADSLF